MPTLSALRRAFFASGMSAMLAGTAQAQTPHHRFHIPAEDAATALRDFARQSGRQVLFDYNLVAGKTVLAVNGDYPDTTVLMRLCDSLGLAVTSDSGVTITLGPKPHVAPVRDPAPSQTALAGDPEPNKVDEVVVTATKRAEPIRNIPISITALTQAKLERVGARSVEDAIQTVAGVSFASNGSNSGVYTIRGVNTATSVGNTQSPVALYVDDINVLDPFYPKITTNLRMFDVERVEVLRGPQGTLFGSGALGGAIRIITNKPDASQFAAATEETVAGTEDGGLSYAVNGMVNAPVIKDKLALRLVGYYQVDGGYVDNVATHDNDVNRTISEGGRAELKWTPTQDLSLTGSALFENDRPHDAGYSFYNSKAYDYNNVVQNQFLNNSQIYNITGLYDAHWATLTSLTTYADRDESSQVDFTPRAQALFGLSAPSPATDAGPSRTFSEEVRLTSPDAQRFRWLIGSLYLNNTHTVDENVIIPGLQTIIPTATTSDAAITDSNFKTQETAIFGEASYDLLDNFTATVGARAFRDILKLDQIVGGALQAPGENLRETSESAVTPKFALTYRPMGSISLYAQASEGYRVGQNNVATEDPLSGQIIPASYHPDHLWNYELGEKGTFFDRRLLINADIYYIDWKDIQLNQHTLVAGVNYIGNAGNAVIRGAEIELQARPIRPLEFGTSLTLNDGRLESVEPGVAATKGDRLPGSAGFMDASYVQYTYALSDDISVYGRLDGRYVGREYSDLDNATALRYGDYGALDMRLGVTRGRYEMVGFIDNLTDNDQKVSALLVSNVPVAIRQRPRTFGLTIRAHF